MTLWTTARLEIATFTVYWLLERQVQDKMQYLKFQIFMASECNEVFTQID
jgi:hypothetical protein